MFEDEYSAERLVVASEASVADGEAPVRWFRALSAIALVYSTAGMLGVAFGLLRFHQGTIVGDYRVHLLDYTISSPSREGLWLFLSALLGAGLAGMLFVGAVGGLQLKAWSLQVLRFWAVNSILLGCGGMYFYVLWLIPNGDQSADVRGVIDTFGSLAGWMIGSVLAVAMLILMHKPGVRAALTRDGDRELVQRKI